MDIRNATNHEALFAVSPRRELIEHTGFIGTVTAMFVNSAKVIFTTDMNNNPGGGFKHECNEIISMLKTGIDGTPLNSMENLHAYRNTHGITFRIDGQIAVYMIHMEDSRVNLFCYDAKKFNAWLNEAADGTTVACGNNATLHLKDGETVIIRDQNGKDWERVFRYVSADMFMLGDYSFSHKDIEALVEKGHSIRSALTSDSVAPSESAAEQEAKEQNEAFTEAETVSAAEVQSETISEGAALESEETTAPVTEAPEKTDEKPDNGSNTDKLAEPANANIKLPTDKAKSVAEEQEEKNAELQAKKEAEEAAQISALSNEDAAARASTRLGNAVEAMTMRLMMDRVGEYLQKKCSEDPEFARLTLPEKKTFDKCIKYVYRKAKEMFDDQTKKREGIFNPLFGGRDNCLAVEDATVYGWAEEYYRDPNAPEDQPKKTTIPTKKADVKTKKGKDSAAMTDKAKKTKKTEKTEKAEKTEKPTKPEKSDAQESSMVAEQLSLFA